MLKGGEKIIQNQVNSLRHLAIIRDEILRRLGIVDTPNDTTAQPVPKVLPASHKYDAAVPEYKLLDVTQYHSEPPDNFTDENIIQFRLREPHYRKQIEVNGANLLVRIKFKKDEEGKTNKTKRNAPVKSTKKRKRKPQQIDLIVSNVTKTGKPGDVLTSLKSKLRKSKLLKLSLPKDVVQKVIDSEEKTLQFFIQCKGCSKKAGLILVHKTRKRKRTKRKGNIKPKLQKRRPILVVHSHIISNGISS